MPSEIAVIAEIGAGRPVPVTLELIAFARAIRQNQSIPIHVFVPGEGIAPVVAELAALPGVLVTGLEGRALAALQRGGLESCPCVPPRRAEAPFYLHRP